jgi:hypothetical protein
MKSEQVIQRVFHVLPVPYTLAHKFLVSSADFVELVRAASLSSSAYSACANAAEDVTITMQLNNTGTDTQVSQI